LEVAAKDPTKAERILCEALAADLYHGPAHNNLGVLMLKTGRLFEAANEFEWARKLLPGHPDPRMNLALTFERAGRGEEALAAYRSALEVYPGHISSLQAMTRLEMRQGVLGEETDEHLREIALRGDSEQWRRWAHHQLMRDEIPKP
jgi:type IV pilus assembly protein PilF